MNCAMLRIGMLLAGTGLVLPAARAAETAAAPDSLVPSSNAVTIDFDTLAGNNDAPFFVYIEHGFEVKARKTGGWLVDTSYGNPAPAIWFTSTGTSSETKAITVTSGGREFAFKSVDFYSSITAIPYQFRGTLKGLTQYVVKATHTNTFGDFVTIANPRPDKPIDMLRILITNPSEGGSNPEAIDNIVVVPVVAGVSRKPD